MKRVMLKDIKLGEVNHVAGFVETIRNKKAMCFIVLRDISGKLQLTIERKNILNFQTLLTRSPLILSLRLPVLF